MRVQYEELNTVNSNSQSLELSLKLKTWVYSLLIPSLYQPARATLIAVSYYKTKYTKESLYNAKRQQPLVIVCR